MTNHDTYNTAPTLAVSSTRKMTDHHAMKMHREKVRIMDKEMITAILKRCEVMNLGLHDEPYPYVVAMNYGFEWEDRLTFYCHMAVEGHRIDLIRQDLRVSVSIYEFLNRWGYAAYQKETHDYRSVHAYGRASIITPDQEEEYIKGLSLLQINCKRPPVKKIAPVMRERLLVLKVEADYVTGKSQYPISSPEEVPIPDNNRLSESCST